MVGIEFDLQKGTIVMSGHATGSKFGENIYCAAASTFGSMMITYFDRVAKAEAKNLKLVDDKKGKAKPITTIEAKDRGELKITFNQRSVTTMIFVHYFIDSANKLFSDNHEQFSVTVIEMTKKQQKKGFSVA